MDSFSARDIYSIYAWISYIHKGISFYAAPLYHRGMRLPRSLAHIKCEISQTKWTEAKKWSYDRSNWKKYRSSKKQLPDPTVARSRKRVASRFYQLKTGHARTGEYLHKDQKSTIRPMLVVRTMQHKADARAPLQKCRHGSTSRRPYGHRSERPPTADKTCSRSPSCLQM